MKISKIIALSVGLSLPVAGGVTIMAVELTKHHSVSFTNKSDTLYINFDSVPETIQTLKDLSLTFSLNEDYKTIDHEASDILVNDKSIKNNQGIVLTDSSLFIPAKYITGNVIISLQVKNITYPVINSSDSDIAFDSLPTEAVQGWSINATFTITDGKLLNYSDCDITLNGQSIKGQSGVLITDYSIQISGDYTYGTIEVKLHTRDKKSCSVDTSSSSGVTFSGISSPVVENTAISATYSIVSSTHELDRDNCDILVDGVSITSKTGVKYLKNEIYIPKELVTGDVTIKIVTKTAGKIDQDWSTIIAACNQYENDKDTTTFLSKLTIDGQAVTSLNQLIGAKKAISFQFYNNSSKAYITTTQNVRVVDYNHDTISDSNTKAALSFQLVNLLSDPDGNQLRCMYDNASHNDYENSNLNDNLNNQSYGYATWYNKNNKQVSDYTDSAYYMLSKADATLVGGIKQVDKYINKNVDGSWQETKHSLKLFPLMFTEVGLQLEGEEPQVETTNVSIYKYWQEHNTNDDRIMKDENNSSWFWWLASPYTSTDCFAWDITDKGEKNHNEVKVERFGVTFGFAI